MFHALLTVNFIKQLATLSELVCLTVAISKIKIYKKTNINMGDRNQWNLSNELTQGREIARQLQVNLNMPSSSHETHELLVQKILTSFENSLSMLNSNSSPTKIISYPLQMSESPPFNGSPRSDQDSDRDQVSEFFKDDSKKRKKLPRWTRHVRVAPGIGLEGPLDDGYSWRKYGQKDILGAKYPRGYYRCTHRHLQGCLATKQVQRSDEDPNIFEVTYRGRHTCHHATSSIIPQHNNITEEVMSSKLSEGHKFTSHEDVDKTSHMLSFSNSLYFKSENDGLLGSVIDHSNVSSSGFMSQPTSGTSYFSVSQGGAGVSQNLQITTSESEISDIISAATSLTVPLDFSFDQTSSRFPLNFLDEPHFF